MTNKEYREHEGISKSQLSHLSKTPMHFKYAMEHPTPDTPALLFGRAAHKYILEKDDFDNEFAVAPTVDRRTNKGKEEWNEFIKQNSNKDIIAIDDMETIKEMREVLYKNPLIAKLLSGEKEQSFFWVDRNTMEACKCRPDCLVTIGDTNIIIDYKTTTNAETQSFMRDAIKLNYDLQAGMYTEGMKQQTGKDYVFMFIAQETKPPYAFNIIQADEYFVKEGNALFHEYLNVYHECKMTDNWYGYEGADCTINNLTLPNWLLKEVM